MAGEVRVPIIGILEFRSNILPPPAESATTMRAPHIVTLSSRTSAVRWEPRERFVEMTGHLMFFYADVKGVPAEAFGRRCIIRRSDGFFFSSRRRHTRLTCDWSSDVCSSD